MASQKYYALILGISSGFGKATALELAKNGYNIYGVHMDMGSNKLKAEELRQEIESYGVQAMFFNVNAADDEKRELVIQAIKENAEKTEGHALRIMVHSLAFGALKYLVSDDRASMVNKKQIEMTMDVMANSLVYWAQDIFINKLFADNSRIIAFTSIGSSKAMLNYGVVSAAKAALEAYIRQLAIELGPYHITSNSIFAGLTDTPAASKIPGFQSMIRLFKRENPMGRVTTENDVAKSVWAISNPDMDFLNGEIIRVDGGDAIYEYLDWDEAAEGRPKPDHGRL